ncbi:origin of replication complex subunit 6-like isoform X3 [Trifolium pratense]|uniref:origin of replication complex subunit 6-like isoform X3 n=1 Tax=Trifolium pratense TaxID=57577 RepID=UPI001E695409|nr:origin of replication complex subunit 6-like isoform X3 [Trifolium pratense]
MFVTVLSLLILLIRCLWLLLFIYVQRNTRYICNNLNTNTWHVVIYCNDMICDCSLQLKVDKIKLIELCGTSEAEFSSVSTTMKDLCHDVFGVAKEKKDPKEVKTNRGMFFPAFPALCADLLDVLPSKRKAEDGGYLSDDGAEGTLDCRI